MDYVAVIVAAAVGFAIGALWYGIFSRQWVAASGVPTNDKGAPTEGANPVTYALGFLCILVVAGMMRHILAMSTIDTVFLGTMAGLGIGLFCIAPWIALNAIYSQRPRVLILIDGGYAAIACAAMGAVLKLF